MREIVKPIESRSDDVKNHYEGGRWINYFQDSSSKKLAERTVRNYKKSVEDIDELSDMEEQNDWIDVFEKFCDIMWVIFMYFWIMEVAVFLFATLVVLVLGICHVIFSLISYVYSGIFLIG